MRFAPQSCLLALVLSSVLPSMLVAEDFKLEEGYSLLFNGKTLDGWKVRGGESLDGKTESPKGRFVVKDGSLVIDANVKGGQVLDTAVEFGPKSHIKFQYKAGPGCNNDLYYLGLKFDIKPGGVKNLKEGEWNDFEIVGDGMTIEFRNNGELQYSGKAKVDASPLGVRAEFGGIEYRQLRYKK
jgi:hypothetical protein